MKKEFAISYQKSWSGDGACYRQCVNLKRETFEKLKDNVLCEIALLQTKYKKERHLINTDNDMLLHLSATRLNIDNGYVFPNLTQTAFFNRYLKLNLKTDRNTYFCIIN